MESNANSSLLDMLAPGALQDRLGGILTNHPHGRVLLALRVGDRYAMAQFDGSGSPRKSELVHTGCITKLLTAAVALDLVRRKGLNIDCSLADLGGRDFDIAPLCSRSVRHLIEHTHGLESPDAGSGLPAYSVTIDRDWLLNYVGSCYASPEVGKYYSYSNIGAWLLASAVEAAEGRPFVASLRSFLARTLAISPATSQLLDTLELEGGGCPSVGARIRIHPQDLLEFVLGCSNPGVVSPLFDFSRASNISLPGWHLLERGSSLGWKSLDSGWFGHHSILSVAPAAIRLHPTRRIAVFITCQGLVPPAILAQIFPSDLPDFGAFARFRILQSQRSQIPYFPPFCGTFRYENIETKVIASANEPQIELECIAPTKEFQYRGLLRPMTKDVYEVYPGSCRSFQFMQFIQADNGTPSHLWNGRNLWRRIS